jgi:hypothetical protein
MQHLDEGTIHAWLDGALEAEEAARVEEHAAACASCAAAVAEARGLAAGASRILASLDNVPSGVIPRTATTVAESAFARGRRRSLWTTLHLTPARAAAAAVLFLAVGTTYVLRHNANDRAVVGFASARDTLAGRAVGGVPVSATPIVPQVSAPTAVAQAAPAPHVNTEAATTSRVQSRRTAKSDAIQPMEGRAVSRAEVAVADSLTSVAEKLPPLPAPGPPPAVAIDAARNGALPSAGGVGGITSRKASTAALADREQFAAKREALALRGYCYALISDSAAHLPQRIVLDSAPLGMARAFSAQAGVGNASSQRHAVGALAEVAMSPLPGWYWSARPDGGIQLWIGAPGLGNVRFDSIAVGELRGVTSYGGRTLTLMLRRIDCSSR